MTGAEVADLLDRDVYRFRNEYDLQAAVGARMRTQGWPVEFEHRLGPRDRPDFLVGRVAVEVKIGGTAGAVARQLARYAAYDAVDEVVLVTCMQRHRSVPRAASGKPVRVVVVRT